MDAIRALAALVVVGCHAQMLFFGNHRKPAEVLTSALHVSYPVKSPGLGHHAVIVFFVLSGFLVGGSAWRSISSGRWSWRNYITNRMTRLWIVLIPALLIGACLDHTGMTLPDSIYQAPAGQDQVHADLPRNLSPRVLAANALFLQTIKTPPYGTNGALWSLANEFWYYVLFPLMLLAFAGNGQIGKRIAFALAGVAILFFVGGKIAALFPVWLLGFVVSLVALRIPSQYRFLATLACLVQFLALNMALRFHPIDALAADLSLGVSFSLLLYAILHARQPNRNRLYLSFAVGFSKFSYTVYLVHLPFLTFLAGLIVRPWHPWPKDTLHLLYCVGLMMAAYAYSWLLYLLFESNTDRLRTCISRRLNQSLKFEAS